ncbi:uncharacterized protein LOC144587804 isoform X2 [Pogona vitticeps]
MEVIWFTLEITLSGIKGIFMESAVESLSCRAHNLFWVPKGACHLIDVGGHYAFSSAEVGSSWFLHMECSSLYDNPIQVYNNRLLSYCICITNWEWSGD